MYQKFLTWRGERIKQGLLPPTPNEFAPEPGNFISLPTEVEAWLAEAGIKLDPGSGPLNPYLELIESRYKQYHQNSPEYAELIASKAQNMFALKTAKMNNTWRKIILASAELVKIKQTKVDRKRLISYCVKTT